MIDAFLHVFPMYLHCFYISATQLQFVEVTNNTTGSSQHEALKGAHVSKMTLHVTFGELLRGSDFSVLRLSVEANGSVEEITERITKVLS